MDNWTYGKGSLVGFLMGFILFILVNPALTLGYYDQFWLLLGCVGTCIALSFVAVTMAIRQVEREFSRQQHSPQL